MRVQSWSPPDLEEIYGLRSVLKPWGSALAATRGLVDTDELETWSRRGDEAAAIVRPPQALRRSPRINDLFHRRVLEGSGDTRLVTLVGLDRRGAPGLAHLLASSREAPCTVASPTTTRSSSALRAGDPDLGRVGDALPRAICLGRAARRRRHNLTPIQTGQLA